MRACCRRRPGPGAAGGCTTRRARPGWSWSSRCASWGLASPDVRRVLDGQVSLAEVAAVHLDALDAQIRALRLHRAVLAVVVKRAAGKEEMTLMNKLAQMSVAERRQMIDDFLAEVFGGGDTTRRGPRAGARPGTCPMTPRLSRSTPGWSWPSWSVTRASGSGCGRVQDIGRANRMPGTGWQDWAGGRTENAVAAVLRGCPPDSAEAAQVLNRILEPAPGLHPADREELIAGLEVTTDPRIERYWQLRPPSTDGRRSRPTCRETFGCSPRCALTGDRQQTAARPARHAAGSCPDRGLPPGCTWRDPLVPGGPGTRNPAARSGT